jgi:hypothetical protein
MDTREVQRWGVLIGGFAIAAALLAASRTEPTDTAPAPTAKVAPVPPSYAGEPQSKAPAAAPGRQAAAASEEPSSAQPLFEAAGQDGGSGNVSFIVRFQPSHPLAQAQSLAQRGKHNDAERAARSMIGSRPDLRGLCFDRFTLGGEYVLRACDAVPAAQRAAFQRNWASRLSKMRGVEYAEPNYVAQPESPR